MPTRSIRSRRKRGAELAERALNSENLRPEDALATGSDALTPEQLNIILSALDDEVERRCKRLKSEANDLAMAIRNAVSIEIMKLPKCVRVLPVNQFRDEHGGKVSSVLASHVNRSTKEVVDKFSARDATRGGSAAGRGVAQTPSGRGSRARIAQTPSGTGTRSVPQTPGTASRRPRKGEAIVSVNGSPLGEVNRASSARTNNPDALNLTVSLPQGELVDLAALKSQDGDASEKLVTLQNLQDTINKMMAELNGA